MPDEKLPLILQPGSGLARVGPQDGRIVAEMVANALAVAQQDGRTSDTANDHFIGTRWDFDAGSHITTVPAIGADGSVFVGSGGRVFALDGQKGTKLWEFVTGGFVCAVSAGPHGPVIAANFHLYAVNGRSGHERWRIENGNLFRSRLAMAVGADGTIYSAFYVRVGESWCGAASVCAIDGITGAKRWEFNLGTNFCRSMAISADGALYVAADRVYALDCKTGLLRWAGSSSPVEEHSSWFALGRSGMVYVSCNGGKLIAFDGYTGRRLWEFSAGEGTALGQPSLAADEMLYVRSSKYREEPEREEDWYDITLHAINARTGQTLWESPLGLSPSSLHHTAAIASDGTVYGESDSGNIVALDGQTGRRLFELAKEGFGKSPVIGEDGVILVSGGSKVYALQSQCKGPALSPWPMHACNAQQTWCSGQ